MSRINTLPKGLQSLLGNTNQGNNPSDLALTVVPTIDIAPFYGPDRLKIESGSVTTGAADATPLAFEVPAGKVCFVQGFACSSAGDMKSATAALIAVNYPNGQNPPIATARKMSTFVANNTDRVGYEFARLFPVPSGVTLQVRVNDIDKQSAGADATFTGHLFFYLLDA